MKVSLWTIKKLALPVARLGDNVVCFFFIPLQREFDQLSASNSSQRNPAAVWGFEQMSW